MHMRRQSAADKQMSRQAADLGVKNVQTCIVAKKALANVKSRGFPGVSSVLLECKAKDGNLLAGNGVEHGVNDALNKALLLVIIDEHHLDRNNM